MKDRDPRARARLTELSNRDAMSTVAPGRHVYNAVQILQVSTAGQQSTAVWEKKGWISATMHGRLIPSPSRGRGEGDITGFAEKRKEIDDRQKKRAAGKFGTQGGSSESH
eukprot:2730086-Pleurochrysis_carterae.AAC.1